MSKNHTTKLFKYIENRAIIELSPNITCVIPNTATQLIKELYILKQSFALKHVMHKYDGTISNVAIREK